ncbi:MAG: hypothetical protein JWO99_481 [Candidatus Saccharibacteria bacterium]|nr:hypothetical protein [Candidatus Saccharibacteria bacterium]
MRDVPKSFTPDFAESRRWRDELELVHGLRDQLGMVVDAEIETTVVALRLLGYKTVMSCGGHVDRRTTGPYVTFESESTHDLVMRAQRESDTVREQELLREAQRVAQREALPLKKKIERFNLERVIAGATTLLELRPVGHSRLRLCFVHADFDGIVEDALFVELMRSRQSEMSKFTSCLKHQLAEEAATTFDVAA